MDLSHTHWVLEVHSQALEDYASLMLSPHDMCKANLNLHGLKPTWHTIP